MKFMASLRVFQPSAVPSHAINRNYTMLQGLDSCSSMVELRQHHAQVIKHGLALNNDVTGRVVKFCALSNSGDIIYALKVFDGIPQPDVFIYNTIMKGLLQRQMIKMCMVLYMVLLESSVYPNSFTIPLLVQACSVGNAVRQGSQVHCHVVKFGFHIDVYCLNNLIQMYVSFHFLDEARKVFDQLTQHNSVSWTTMISGYSKWGLIENAREVFELMACQSSVPAAWNAMIAAYVQSNRFQEAFALFNRMQSANLVLDKYVAATMLSACTGLGAVEQGKWIHQCIEKSGIKVDSKLATSIIDMYCKCGCLEKAFEVFNSMPQKVVSVSSWNSMIGGLAIHGQGEAAIELFKKMERKKAAPDHITFVNLLNACTHSGLVEQGQFYFQYMSEVYGFHPTAEHYGCMVDLLGRAGLLNEAEQLVNQMLQSIVPDASVLGALLGACRLHGNIDVGKQVGHKLIELEPENSGRYVLLANLYAKAGCWEDVANIRNLMNSRGVKKPPGSSMIELDGAVSEFIAGDNAHPHSSKIYSKLHEMLERIRHIGYTPDTQGVLQELNDEDKESPLLFHSEKLAIAYGLIHSKPGQVLRITKNLRVCKDCHEATKLISLAYDREIIVRDRKRFHHFRDGVCSCRDYW